MPTITLTDTQLRTVLKSLAVCEGDMNDARDNSRSDACRNYYNTKAYEYKTTWDAVYNQVHRDDYFSSLDKAMLESEASLDHTTV